MLAFSVLFSPLFANAQAPITTTQTVNILKNIANNDEEIKKLLVNISSEEMIDLYFDQSDPVFQNKLLSLFREASSDFKEQEFDALLSETLYFHNKVQEIYDFTIKANLTTTTNIYEFQPLKNITREEVAAIIYRSIFNDLFPNPDEVYDTKKFNDRNKIAPEFRTAIDTLSRAGIFRGDAKGNFRPKDPVTNQESVLLIMRLILKDSSYSDKVVMEYFRNLTNTSFYQNVLHEPTVRIGFFWLMKIIWDHWKEENQKSRYS